MNKRRFLVPYMMLAGVAELLIRCSFTPLAGGGTEDVNTRTVVGKVFISGNHAAPNTQVRLVPEDYDPVKNRLDPDLFLDTTDAQGAYRFTLSRQGTYTIQAVHLIQRTRLFIASVSVRSDTTTVSPGILRYPGTIKIVLPDGLDTTNGYVYIPGTTIYVPLSGNNGSVVLDSVPAGIIPSIVYASGNTTISTRVIEDSVTVQPGAITTLAYSAWKYSKKLYLNTTASGANIQGIVCDFPVVIRLTDSNFDFGQANADGNDLRFAKQDGYPLPYKIEQWDALQKRAAIWVKADTVYGNDSMHFIEMFWGNPRVATASNSAAVFDTADGFAGVWHFADSCNDASSNSNDGTASGTVFSTGMVGNAGEFNGIDTYIKIDSPANGSLDFGLSSFSYSLWVYVTSSVDSFDVAWSKGGTNPGLAGYCIKLGLGDWNTAICDGTTMIHGAFGMEQDFLGKWTLLSVVVDRDSSLLKTYTDGTMTDRIDISTLGPVSSNLPAYIGMENVSYFKGLVDELRIARGTVSSDWIRLSYANQRAIDQLVVRAK